MRTVCDSYRISRPIRCTFFPEKCDLNSTCVLCAKSKQDDVLYEESDALSENNHEDDFSGSDDNFLGFCVE
jgi:hypothetical protein